MKTRQLTQKNALRLRFIINNFKKNKFKDFPFKKFKLIVHKKGNNKFEVSLYFKKFFLYYFNEDNIVNIRADSYDELIKTLSSSSLYIFLNLLDAAISRGLEPTVYYHLVSEEQKNEFSSLVGFSSESSSWEYYQGNIVKWIKNETSIIKKKIEVYELKDKFKFTISYQVSIDFGVSKTSPSIEMYSSPTWGCNTIEELDKFVYPLARAFMKEIDIKERKKK